MIEGHIRGRTGGGGLRWSPPPNPIWISVLVEISVLLLNDSLWIRLKVHF